MSTWRRAAAILVFLAVASALRYFVLLHELQSALLLPTSEFPITRFRLSPHLHVHRTPRVQTYDFILREETKRPDGIEKRVLTINGLFPGPTIEARSGDTLVVNVENLLLEGTSLHWHGLRHEDGSNSQDGAVGVTQCPIAPGASYTYKFNISNTQAGTFWYHSHHTTQRSDGLFGAFIVHAAPNDDALRDEMRLRPRALDPPRRAPQTVEQVLLIGDWYHRSGEQVFQWFQSARSGGREPVPDVVLINGQQTFDCSKSIVPMDCEDSEYRRPRFILDQHKDNIMRFVNTGILATVFISIDQHELEVLEADGTLLESVMTKELPISPGQRYSIRPRLGRKPQHGEAFWLRHRVDQGEFMYPNAVLNPEPKAIVSYGAIPNTQFPATDKWASKDDFDVLALKPRDLVSRVLPPAEETVMIYVTTMKRNTHGYKPFGYVNQTTWRPDLKYPLLVRNEEEWGDNEFIISTARNRSQVVDIIVNNLEEGTHPFHLHGHSFWPLHVHESEMGWGTYRWNKPPNLPDSAPALRDTFSIPRRGHAVFRIKFDTPGMWMFHCHVLVHMHSGMAMTFNVRSEDSARTGEREKVMEMCRETGMS